MSYPLAPGIRFNDCVFSEPATLPGATLSRCAGLFVILAEDRNWAPKTFQPLYFGEYGNNPQEYAILQEATRSLKGWQDKTLYLAVLPLPFSTTTQRWALSHELMRAYNPSCQSGPSNQPPSELVRRLDALEKTHHEQTAQLLWLRASADYLLGATPERRRRIGFLPEILPAL